MSGSSDVKSYPFFIIVSICRINDLEKYDSLGDPPSVKTGGFIIRDNEYDIGLAQERNEDSNFRTEVFIPKKLISDIPAEHKAPFGSSDIVMKKVYHKKGKK